MRYLASLSLFVFFACGSKHADPVTAITPETPPHAMRTAPPLEVAQGVDAGTPAPRVDAGVARDAGIVLRDAGGADAGSRGDAGIASDAGPR
ncbi:MAG: hypothetical protein ABI867_20920 [Kofleriaceae bacterium]